MQTRKPLTPTETRRRMLAQGLNPEACKNFMQESCRTFRSNFEIIRPLLSQKEANELELQILNGEIMLSIIRNACL